MNKKIELLKNTAIIFLGKFCTQLISFILVPIYTYFLSTEDYGYVDLVQTYFSLIIPIILLRIDSAIFRFLIDYRNDENGKNDLISSTVIFLFIQIVVSSLLLIIFNMFVELKYFPFIFLNLIFISISTILLQICRGVGDNVGYSISCILSGITTIILNIIFIVILKFNGEFILVSSAFANFVCSLYLIIRLKLFKVFDFRFFKLSKLKEMTKYSLPMIPDGLSWWIMNVSDRSIISFVLGVASNGIYAVSSKFSNIISSLFQVFNMSWQESASLHVNDEDKDDFFSNILNSTYEIFFSICLLLLTIMPFIFKFIIGENYFSAYYYVPVLLIGNLYNAVANVIGGVYIANKNTSSVAKTTIISALINIIINISLIKIIGLYAAAISTLVSYVVLTVYRFIDSKKYVKWMINYKMLVFSSILYILICILYYLNLNLFIYLFVVIFVLILLYIVNKSKIVIIIKKIKKRGKVK